MISSFGRLLYLVPTHGTGNCSLDSEEARSNSYLRNGLSVRCVED